MSANKLYYGDNLDILRDHNYFPNACVDLIYLDPPFNSSRSYNVLFKDESGRSSDAQITAFEDTWHWGETAERTLDDLVMNAPPAVAAAMEALRTIIGRNQMLAYLVMMTARLVELHRVLKPTGSLYLHCDPTASHYLKIILDTIFGVENFRNEIIWKRSSAHSDSSTMGNTHDVILFYTKSKTFIWNKQFQPYDDNYVQSHYNKVSADGRKYRTGDLTAFGLSGGGYTYEWNGVTKLWRLPEERMRELHEQGRIRYTKSGTAEYIRYLDEMPGTPLQDVWDDISPVNPQAKERLGYPTQKPVALLERIVGASSNPGDVVLDPFCGCGTAIAAAQKLGRQWIGIDITHLSVALMKYRLRDMFSLEAKKDYGVVGEPEDLSGAQQLASEDRYQFQWWALSLLEAQPLGGQEGSKTGKKGSDKGIDGMIPFVESVKGQKQRKTVLIQVKSGHVQRTDIADLVTAVAREKAAMGLFITLEPSTEPMRKEALSAGYYRSEGWNTDYPKIQIVTVEELLHGKGIDMPQTRGAFKQAERVKTNDSEQTSMFGDE